MELTLVITVEGVEALEENRVGRLMRTAVDVFHDHDVQFDVAYTEHMDIPARVKNPGAREQA